MILVERLKQYRDAVAIIDKGARYSYSDLSARARELATILLRGRDDLDGARIAYQLPAGVDHTAMLIAIWMCGGVAVPIGLSATDAEIDFQLDDSQASQLVVEHDSAGRRFPSTVSIVALVAAAPTVASNAPLRAISSDRPALILYTSGTTSKPKGVVLSHAALRAQIESLIVAWRWSPSDRVPLFLPLHHIHGVVNVMLCAIWAGATLETFAKFEVDAVLERVAAGAYTVFMAVPTIYVKIIERLESLEPGVRETVLAGFREMRLMVSGSAALPTRVFERWERLTGQRLLERYGMTEIGMALSNPYAGERRPGTVGQPLPGVEVRLKDESGVEIGAENRAGEIWIRGPGIFSEYWNRADATAAAFSDGWFRTGDVAIIEYGSYRILGRRQIDIIKSGGYKLSALEIEAALLEHPAIRECAVVGLPDDSWGEVVAVAAVLRSNIAFEVAEFHSWTRRRLSPYKAPRLLLVVDALPCNAMEKVSKADVKRLFLSRTPLSLSGCD